VIWRREIMKEDRTVKYKKGRKLARISTEDVTRKRSRIL
jgi:hypothetical protein